MKWCCDCKNKYINTKCVNCSKMNNYEKGDAVNELLENIKTEINFIAEKCLSNNVAEEYEAKGLKEAIDIIDKHIKENEQ